MNPLSKIFKKLNSFDILQENLQKEKAKINVQGVLDSQKEHLIFGVKEALNNKSIIVTHNEKKAKEIYDNLQFYYKDKVFLYPQKDILFYSADVKSVDIMKERSKIYEAIFSNKDIAIIVPIDALFDRLSPKEILEKEFLNINLGDEVKIQELGKKLLSIGYKRREQVDSAGQFAIRGGIIDIFTTTYNTAIRLEFWGDEVDSIRILDEYNSRSVDNIESVKISPISELVYNEDDIPKAITQINKEYQEALSNFEKYGMHEEYDNLRYYFSQMLEELREFGRCKNMELLLPYFYNEKISLFDYLSDDYIIYFDEINRIEERGQFIEAEYNESFKSRILKGYMLETSTHLINNLSDITSKSANFRCVNLTSVMGSAKNDIFKKSTIIDFNVKYTLSMKNDLIAFKDEIKNFKDNGYTVIVFSGSKTRALSLVQDLEEENVTSAFYESLENVDLQNSVYILRGSINRGFVYPDIKVAFISDTEVFVENKKAKTKAKKFKDGKKINSYTDLNIGDYVVHINHGIGIFKGVEKITLDGVSKDYVKIGFADGGNIYAPTNQLDLIQKYIGKDAKGVKLNKLGGAEWKKTKEKAKKAVIVLAKELLELYARREASKGFEYSEDNVWQKEFEERGRERERGEEERGEKREADL